MNPARSAVVVGTLLIVASALAACAAPSSKPIVTAQNVKAVFCQDNAMLSKESASATSSADFVSILRTDTAAVNGFAHNIPSAGIRSDAEKLVAATRSSLASNNASAFNAPDVVAAGAHVDTYCGQQSDGSPLPKNFAAGRGTAFCTVEATITTGLEGSATPAAAVTFLKNNTTALDTFVAKTPVAEQSDAQSLLSAARSAVTQNDGTKILTQATASVLNSLDLYCGVNH
jgi:hypothetical protein